MVAAQLHQNALIWDAHRDVAYEMPLEERFLNRQMIGVDLHLPRVLAGGLHVQTYALCVGTELGLDYTAQALKELDAIYAILDANADKAALVTTTAQALEARQQGKLAVFLNFEGAEPIHSELALLRMFYRLGLRAMSLTWNWRNDTADGGFEVPGGKLSLFGVEVIKEMNRLGMVIDLAHLNPTAMHHILDISEQPVIHSHCGVKGINQTHPRALTDEILDRIAAGGGVVCLTTVPGALTGDRPGVSATLELFLDAVEYTVKRIGADHVGLGADFDVYQSHLPYAIGGWTEGLEEADCWPKVTAGLLARGHSEADVRKIMGENLLRVYRQVVG